LYLAHQPHADASGSQTISDFRHEMDRIGRVVMAFLRKYSEANFTPETADAFRGELEEIGAALTDRIRREEEILYPLYRPHY
jgi:disulfide oxidoreductase YuzD